MELAVNNVFGHGSVPIDLVNENRQLFIETMRKWNWHSIKGTLTVAFLRQKPKRVELEFGNSLDKKEVKQLLKDMKKANESEAKLSA